MHFSPDIILSTPRLKLTPRVTRTEIPNPTGPTSALTGIEQQQRLLREAICIDRNNALALTPASVPYGAWRLGENHPHHLLGIPSEEIKSQNGQPPANILEMPSCIAGDLLFHGLNSGRKMSEEFGDTELAIGYNYGEVASLRRLAHMHCVTGHDSRWHQLPRQEVDKNPDLSGLLFHNVTGERIGWELMDDLRINGAEEYLNLRDGLVTPAGTLSVPLHEWPNRESCNIYVELWKNSILFIQQQWDREGIGTKRLCCAVSLWADNLNLPPRLEIWSAMTINHPNGGLSEAHNRVIDGSQTRAVTPEGVELYYNWLNRFVDVYRQL